MATAKEIEEIKARVNIFDLVSQYVTLKRSGASYFGLCPFHNEKTPSFSVTPDLGFFNCFGCQEHGDVIAFLQKIESLSFSEAIEKLATIAGVTLSQEYTHETSHKKRIIEMNAIAQKFFAYLLFDHPSGAPARAYLTTRHISDDSARIFGLGYDKGNSLTTLLRKRGYSDKEIVSYGLAVERRGQLMDKYRNRLIFPLYSISGDIIGFSGRVIEATDIAPKYINSPETEVFKKHLFLYGLWTTKKAIREKNHAILLEGPIDVISSYQHGVTNVCAVQGTSLTPDHLTILKRLTHTISFCFDQDNAGFKALKRSVAIAMQSDIVPSVITIHDAKDVDERVNSNEEGFHHDMEHPLDAFTYLITSSRDQMNTSTVKGKLSLVNEILPLIAQIPNPITQTEYLQKLSQEAEVDIPQIRKMLPRSQHHHTEVMPLAQKKAKKTQQEYLLILFLQHSQELFSTIKDIDLSLFSDPMIHHIFSTIQDHMLSANDLKQSTELLSQEEQSYCEFLMGIHIPGFENVSKGTLLEEIQKTSAILSKKKLMKEVKELRSQLWIAEQEQNDSRITTIMEEIATKTSLFST